MPLLWLFSLQVTGASINRAQWQMVEPQGLSSFPRAWQALRVPSELPPPFRST